MARKTTDEKKEDIKIPSFKLSLKCKNQKQKEFANNINKTRDWQASNEIGRCRYSIDDLIKIANTYDLDIIIKDKQT